MNAPQQSHRWGLAVLIGPGAALALFALLADLARGGRFLDDWGTGQTLMLVTAAVLAAFGLLIHRKAIQDERAGKRRYSRTVTFVAAPLVLLILMPVCVAESVARLMPKPDDTGTSYRQTDPRFGFSIAPDREYHVVSRAKDFDIRVRIDTHGFRQGPGDPVDVASADVVVVGDSHPFGFGVAEGQTLPAHLSTGLREAELPDAVLNAGVPGFGLGQSLLRIRSFQSLRPGAVIVVFINPMNDLVNLSSAVDYHYPKPHPVIVNDRLDFQPAPADWGEGAFLFSDTFDSLNRFFGMADRRKWYRSVLLQRLADSKVAPATADGITMLIDDTSPEQYVRDDETRIASDPMLYASRFWPEMPAFAAERKALSDLVDAVMKETQQACQKNEWHLVCVIAEEAYAHQQYSRNFLNQVQAVLPETPIELGWSRETMIAACERASIVTVISDYSGLDVESLFVQNDDHTSGIGHQQIAAGVIDKIVDAGWLK